MAKDENKEKNSSIGKNMMTSFLITAPIYSILIFIQTLDKETIRKIIQIAFTVFMALFMFIAIWAVIFLVLMLIKGIKEDIEFEKKRHQ